MRAASARRVVGLVLGLGIAIFAVRLADRFDGRWDATRGERASLSEGTRRVVELLGRDVEIVAFLRRGGPDEPRIRRLLDRLEHASDRIRGRILDPEESPALADEYGATSTGTVVMTAGDRRELVRSPDEAAIASALVKLAREKVRRVRFLGGHRERSIRDAGPDGLSSLREALAAVGVESDEGTLLTGGPRAPAGDPAREVDAVVLAGPRDDLFEEEIVALDRYLDRGGRLLALVDPRELPRLEAFLRGRGVALGPDVVLDPSTRVFGADATVPVITRYARHPVTDAVAGRSIVPTFLPLARTVRAVASSRSGERATEIAHTGPHAWAETDPRSLVDGGSPSRGPQEAAGPLPVAVAVSTSDRGEPLAVVLGDSDLAANGNLALSGNRALALSSLEWLLEGGLERAVPWASRSGGPLLLTPDQVRMRVAGPAFALPLLSVLLGLGVWLVRRRS